MYFFALSTFLSVLEIVQCLHHLNVSFLSHQFDCVLYFVFLFFILWRIDFSLLFGHPFLEVFRLIEVVEHCNRKWDVHHHFTDLQCPATHRLICLMISLNEWRKNSRKFLTFFLLNNKKSKYTARATELTVCDRCQQANEVNELES